MIGRENFSVSSCHVTPNTFYVTIPIEKYEPAEPPSCVYTQAVSVSCIHFHFRLRGLRNRVPHLPKRWPVMLKVSFHYLS